MFPFDNYRFCDIFRVGVEGGEGGGRGGLKASIKKKMVQKGLLPY